MVHQPVAEDAQRAMVGTVGRIAQPVAQGALVAVLGQGLVHQAGGKLVKHQAAWTYLWEAKSTEYGIALGITPSG